MITVLHRGSPKNDYSIAYILGRGIYQEYDLRGLDKIFRFSIYVGNMLEIRCRQYSQCR